MFPFSTGLSLSSISSVHVFFFHNPPSPPQARALRRRLKPYMLRRRKEDVTKDIPPKEETVIDVELTMVQKKYYRAIYERNHSVLNKVRLHVQYLLLSSR